MKCSKCGEEYPDGARHCTNCGAACPETAIPPQSAPAQPVPQPAQQEQQTPPPQPSSTPFTPPRLSWWAKIWCQPRMARKDFWLFLLILMLLEGVGSATVVIPIFLCIFEITIWMHRLHDADHSAWHLLWCLTIIGSIVPLILCCQKGTPGPNRFGEEPQRIF